MIYVKSGDIRIALTEKCFFSDCPVCGKPTSVDYGLLIDIIADGDIKDTSVYCDKCSDDYRKSNKPIIKRIK